MISSHFKNPYKPDIEKNFSIHIKVDEKTVIPI